MRKHLPLILIVSIFLSIIVFMVIKSINKGVVKGYDDHEFLTEVSNELIKICIKGEVTNPGIYEIEKGSILDELIKKAGGLTLNAGEDINLVYELNKNLTIYVRSKDEAGGMDILNDTGVLIQTEDEIILFEEKVNINTASVETLCILPGIGEKTAINILRYRETNGGFLVIEDIMKVAGIKTAKFEKIKDYITVSN